MNSDKVKQDTKGTVGKNIRRIRKKKKIGQTEMVRELQLMEVDISRETLVKIERGIQHIQLEQLWAIKRLLKVSYDDLLDEYNEDSNK